MTIMYVQDFETCKLFLLERAKEFLEMKQNARNKIMLLGETLPIREVSLDAVTQQMIMSAI